jgi:hypothetical protein
MLFSIKTTDTYENHESAEGQNVADPGPTRHAKIRLTRGRQSRLCCCQDGLHSMHVLIRIYLSFSTGLDFGVLTPLYLLP